MRAVEVAGARLCLNGEPVFLKGLNWHEETAERGRSMRRQDYDQILDIAADLGANFLRSSPPRRGSLANGIRTSRSRLIALLLHFFSARTG